MAEQVEFARANFILEIRLNRPEKKNAITEAMYAAMAAALVEAEPDPAIRVVLFSGNGSAFCAGNDLSDFVASPPVGTEAPVFRFLRAVSESSKVLIAGVQGAAIGIGTTLLLHCDLVVAAKGARLALPFVNLGLVPEAASSLLLPRLIGHQRAAELFLLGESFDAATALGFGLVNRVVEEDEVLATARGLAQKVAAKAPSAVRLIKRLMRSKSATVRERMEEEARDFAGQLGSAELQEAVTAFFEKRAPDFSRSL
jgi:enoyl-CoA hydratase/carnithine racemase